VEAGSIVKRDEIIARLENRDMLAEAERARANVAVTKAQLGQANAELYDAKLGLDRARGLIRKRYVTQEVYDAALARFRKAEAAVASAKSAITAAEAASRSAEVAVDYTVIRAPFDGVVTVKNANVGDIVAPFSSAGQSKAAVVSMADLDTLEVEVDVSESNLQKVKHAQPCEIQLDALPDVRLRGTVKTIVPTVDKTKATVLVKVAFDDHDRRVLPDMSAKVAFLSQALKPGQQEVLTVVAPSAVQKQDDKSVVFVVRDGRAYAVTIETGSRLGDWVVVKAGLAVGDKIVTSDVAGLTDGVPVTPKNS
jgi:RND family efflux transporter MFP subunit